ncbi:MAG: SUMF1/EgtB/PvdO family nonheme iron enzyme [Terriglobia bacterium]|jgi:formylglycine-generating enzyme required for sulfatase activity
MMRFIWIVALMTSLGMAAEPLRVENRHVDRKLPGCGNEKDGCDHVEFTYVEVVGGPAAARKRINAEIMACVLFGPGTDSEAARDTCKSRPTLSECKSTPELAAQAEIDFSASIYKDHPSWQPSALSRWVTVLRTAAPVLSLGCSEISSGGAHPISSAEYLNFDPATGEPIKLVSILKDGAMARLTAIAETHFRQKRKLAANAKLEDEGFTFPGGRFELNDNYGFGEKALLFLFNENEIAPGYMGPTLVEIPYSEIRDLIRPEFPLAELPGATAPRPTRTQGPAPGQVRENPKDGLKYVWIPPGTFMMGCSPGDTKCGDDEKPPHQVTITKGFWLGQTEVTVGAYKRFAGATGRQLPPEPMSPGGKPLNPGWGDEAMPIVMVTWNDAYDYCTWAGGRLPTEAEWEYGARAGSTQARYGELDDIAWYADNSGRQRLDSDRIDPSEFWWRLNENGNGMHEVGQKRANGFGLYDMLGNVDEWVNDWYDENYYQNSPSQDPAGPVTGAGHIDRGECWGSPAMVVRVSRRDGDWYVPGARSIEGGFRCGGEVFATAPAGQGARTESPLANLAQMKPQSSGQEAPVVHVPFVGCNADGQVGPVAAPKGDEKVVQMDASTAQRLAYYKAGFGPGVLAPRGWYCFGRYGSSGSGLFVTPQPIKRDDLLSRTGGGFTGPAIQVSLMTGGTSGRFTVARFIARLFPAQKAFVESVIKEGLEPASDFPFGPYPKDKLTIRSDEVVEYQTPPNSEGLGTMMGLPKNDNPIDGVAILFSGDGLNVLHLAARLPSDIHDLTSEIVKQWERNSRASLSEK